MWILAAVHLATAAASPEIRIAAPDFVLIQVDDKIGKFYVEHLTQQLSQEPGFRVTTSTEIAALLGLERQKELMGCADGSCTAELAGALGVDGLMIGSLAKLARGYALHLKVLAASDGRQLSVISVEAPDEDALLKAFEETAKRVAREVTAALHPAAPVPGPPVVEVRPGIRRLTWIPAAGGAALLLTGSILFGVAQLDAGRLRNNDPNIVTRDQYLGAVSSGKAEQTAGLVVGAVGVAAIAAAVGFFVFGADTHAQVGIGVSPTGVAGTVGGSW